MNDPSATTPSEAPARVDLAFALRGDLVPAEHGYPLFAALCAGLGDLHGAQWLSVHPVRGDAIGDGTLRLRPYDRPLRLRVDRAQVTRVLALSGVTLNVDGHPVTVGDARLFALEPTDTLHARMVVLRNGVERRPDFDAALRQRLDALGVQATAEVPSGMDARRVLRIRQQAIAGYPVTLRGLSPMDSLRVQTLGIGGHQRFGCGVFARE